MKLVSSLVVSALLLFAALIVRADPPSATPAYRSVTVTNATGRLTPTDVSLFSNNIIALTNALNAAGFSPGGGGSATNVSLSPTDNTITVTTNSSSSWSIKVNGSVVLTNGGSFSASSLVATNVSVYGSVVGIASATPTNYTIIPDFRIGEHTWITNGPIVFGAPINVTTNYNHDVFHLLNTTGTVLTITPAAGWVITGTWNVTNYSLVHIWTAVGTNGLPVTNGVCVQFK